MLCALVMSYISGGGATTESRANKFVHMQGCAFEGSANSAELLMVYDLLPEGVVWPLILGSISMARTCW